jgi:hypothetical protein
MVWHTSVLPSFDGVPFDAFGISTHINLSAKPITYKIFIRMIPSFEGSDWVTKPDSQPIGYGTHPLDMALVF